MAVAAWLLIILGAALVVLGGIALFLLKTSENSEIDFKVFKITTPVPGIAVAAIGIGAILLGTKEIPVSVLSVVNVSLATNDGNLSSIDYGDVLCPMSVELVGSISTSGGSGTVTYRFDKAEGVDGQTVQGAAQTVSFTSPGTVTVRDNEPVTIPEGTVYFREFLTIVSPGDRQSNPVSVTVVCDPTAPPAPPNPPPSVGSSSQP
jgi:hypothetical protein